MSKSLFFEISKYIQVDKYDAEGKKYSIDKNKIELIKEFIEHTNENLETFHKIELFLTIDGFMASFQGRIYFKQYLKMKKRKC